MGALWRDHLESLRLCPLRRRALVQAVVVFVVLIAPSACSGIGGTAETTPGFATLPSGPPGHVLTLWSWAGTRVGTVHVTPSLNSVVTSPDGTRALAITGSGNLVIVSTDTGSVLAQEPIVGGVTAWADDSRKLCGIGPVAPGTPGDESALTVIDPPALPRVVADTLSGKIAYCSVAKDEAIILGAGEQGQGARTKVVGLSSGAVSTPAWQPTCENPCIVPVAVSGNGSYVLETVTPGGGQVVDIATQEVAASLAGQPLAVSWDGHAVLELSKDSTQLEVFDWQTRRVLWRSTDATPPAGVLCTGPSASVATAPGTDDLALLETGSCLAGGPHELWLVPVSGKPEVLDTDVNPNGGI